MLHKLEVSYDDGENVHRLTGTFDDESGAIEVNLGDELLAAYFLLDICQQAFRQAVRESMKPAQRIVRPKGPSLVGS